MSSTNFMELTGSGSSNDLSSATVSTLPSHVITTVSYHTHYSPDNSDNISDDEKTVAIVLACAFISLIVGWVGHRLYQMSRETRRRRDACAAQMVEEATVTVEGSISNTVASVAEDVAEKVESATEQVAESVAEQVESAATSVVEGAASVVEGATEQVADGADRANVTNI